jgi:uncharacterized protein (TIGR03067 family)
MSIRIECSCGKKLAIKEEMAGRRVKCPGCASVLTVPKASTKQKPVDASDDSVGSGTDYFNQKLPPRTGKGRGTSASRSSGKTQGRSKSNSTTSTNRTTLIALSAGIGVLAIGLTGWMLWPTGPDADSGNAASGTATADPSVANVTASSSGSDDPAAGNGSQNATTVGMTPQATEAPELSGDLKLLQGTWQVTDFKTDANQPTPPDALRSMKNTTLTFDGGFLLQRGNNEVDAFSVRIKSTQSLKGIELTRLSNGVSYSPENRSWVYTISDDTLNVCLNKPGANPPTELVANAALGHAVLSLSRMRETISENPRFDYAAWIKASEKLKELEVRAELMTGKHVYSDTELVVLAGSIELVDGVIPAKIWSVLLSQSRVVVRFTEKAVLTDATLQQLSQHPGLVGFGLDGPHSMTPTGVKHLQKCPVFCSLICFSKTPFTPEVLRSFTDLDALQYLAINEQPVSRDLISLIAKAKKLRSLHLYGTGVTDEDLVSIATLTNLESLHLEKTKITDNGMLQIGKLAALRVLFLPETITDQGLEQLKSLTHLEELFLTGATATTITDKGLQSLKKHTGLKLLIVRNSGISPQGYADFESALPGCKVIR